jgi:hypothetical protein
VVKVIWELEPIGIRLSLVILEGGFLELGVPLQVA